MIKHFLAIFGLCLAVSICAQSGSSRQSALVCEEQSLYEQLSEGFPMAREGQTTTTSVLSPGLIQ